MAHSGELPEEMRSALRKARLERKWSQSATGKRAGVTQKHLSAIEAGKIVPRVDTLLDVARALDFELVIVPRRAALAVRALVHDLTSPDADSTLRAPEFASLIDTHDYGPS